MTESTPYDVSLSREKGDEFRTPAANTTLPVSQSTAVKGKDTPAVRVSANNNLSSTPLPFRTLCYNEPNASASSAPSQSQFSTHRAKVRSAVAKKSPPPPIDVLVANCYMTRGKKKNREEKEGGESTNRAKVRSTLAKKLPPPPIDVLTANSYMTRDKDKNKEEKGEGEIRESRDDHYTWWDSAPGFAFFFSCFFEWWISKAWR